MSKTIHTIDLSKVTSYVEDGVSILIGVGYGINVDIKYQQKGQAVYYVQLQRNGHFADRRMLELAHIAFTIDMEGAFKVVKSRVSARVTPKHPCYSTHEQVGDDPNALAYGSNVINPSLGSKLV